MQQKEKEKLTFSFWIQIQLFLFNFFFVIFISDDVIEFLVFFLNIKFQFKFPYIFCRFALYSSANGRYGHNCTACFYCMNRCSQWKISSWHEAVKLVCHRVFELNSNAKRENGKNNFSLQRKKLPCFHSICVTLFFIRLIDSGTFGWITFFPLWPIIVQFD